MHGVWPGPLVRPVAELSPELPILVLLAAGIAEYRGGLGPTARRVLAGTLLLLILGRYVDVTAPVLFGREIHLYWDLRHLPSVAEMLWAALPVWQVVSAAMAALLALVLLALAVRLCVRAIGTAFARPVPRRTTAALAAVTLAGLGIGMASETVQLEQRFALAVTPVYAGQLAFLLAAAEAKSEFAPVPPDPAGDAALRNAARCGLDIYALFIESYGATAFTSPTFRTLLAPRLAALGRAIEGRGLSVASALATSPTFGGTSWLAHASLLTGIQVPDQRTYHLLLASGRAGLPKRFREAGYWAVALFPGLKRPWTEGAAYGFDRIYDAAAIHYRGPAFGWWAIPDQFSLETLYRREIAPPGRRPLFVAGATILSHMPFRPIPDYVADWDRLGDGRAIPPPAADESGDLIAAYGEGIAYQLDVLRGFIAGRAPERLLMLVLGDHQPLAAVAGPNASHAVPVHVITGIPPLLGRFTQAGFSAGLDPGEGGPAGTIADLHGLLIEAVAALPPCTEAPR